MSNQPSEWERDSKYVIEKLEDITKVLKDLNDKVVTLQTIQNSIEDVKAWKEEVQSVISTNDLKRLILNNEDHIKFRYLMVGGLIVSDVVIMIAIAALF